jgi:hypothetical protein
MSHTPPEYRGWVTGVCLVPVTATPQWPRSPLPAARAADRARLAASLAISGVLSVLVVAAAAGRPR